MKVSAQRTQNAYADHRDEILEGRRISQNHMPCHKEDEHFHDIVGIRPAQHLQKLDADHNHKDIFQKGFKSRRITCQRVKDLEILQQAVNGEQDAEQHNDRHHALQGFPCPLYVFLESAHESFHGNSSLHSYRRRYPNLLHHGLHDIVYNHIRSLRIQSLTDSTDTSQKHGLLSQHAHSLPLENQTSSQD